MCESPAIRHLNELGVPYRLVRHSPVSTIAEAARVRGIPVRDLVKTIVVRKGQGEYLFVLVPGDCQFSWPKMRALLGISRLRLADEVEARLVSGYEPGTITPFGAANRLPIYADASIRGRSISMGAGEPHTGLMLEADDVIRVLNPVVADLVSPQEAPTSPR